MLRRLKGHRLLEGFRGSPPVDQDRLVDIVRRVPELAAEGRDRIAEIDADPLVCAGSRQVAVDAFTVRRAAP